MERRTLIRLLVVLGIGVPVLLEAVTFLGLVSHQFGDGVDGGSGTTPTATGVAVGDDLVEATPQSDRIETAYVQAGGETWTFHLRVAVENTGSEPYELRLGAVAVDGQTVDGSATTGTVPPGETATASGTWDLPAGATPDSITVTAVRGGSATQHVVPFRDVQVRS